MSELVEYRPIRVSVRTLREHLTANGPTGLATLIGVARLDDARITGEMVTMKLASHPGVFCQLTDGRYAAVPPAETIVTRARPRPAARPARQDPTGRRQRPSPPQPPAEAWHPEPGRSAKVTVDDDAVLHESGRRLLIELSGPRAKPVLPSGSADGELAELQTVELFQRHPTQPAVIYRGSRPVIEVIRHGSDIRLVLGPAAGFDWGQAARPAMAALTAGQVSDGSALVVRRTFWDSGPTVLSPAAQQSALLPPARTRTARQPVYRHAQELLVQVRDNSNRWRDFAEWVARSKSQGGGWDQELLENVIAMALAYTSPLPVARLAVDVLGASTPMGNSYAEALLPHVVEIGTREARDYAQRLIEHCRNAGVARETCDIPAAKLALSDDRYDDACRLYHSAATGADVLDPGDLADYLIAASYSDDLAATQALIDLDLCLEHVEAPADRISYAAAIGNAVDLANEHAKPVVELLSLIIQLRILASDETGAQHEYQSWGTGLKIGDRLDVLSVFENAEKTETIDWLRSVLYIAVQAASRQPNIELFGRAVDQLRSLETQLGHLDHPYSTPFEKDLHNRSAAATAVAPVQPPLDGLALTIVGGNSKRRALLIAALQRQGARNVREVPPHWEGRIDSPTIEERTAGADAVILLTDEVGHQEQVLLRNSRVRLVFTQGGPSRVLRELRARLIDGAGAAVA